MFGFARLGSYDYFAHVQRAIERCFDEAGEDVVTHVADVLPTASIRTRASTLARLVSRTAASDRGPIHMLGHSTGGLDARLVASPSVHLPIGPDEMGWLERLASVTTMNTPHYGTPLASFFATVSGQRLLHALSALTYIALSVGAPPLAVVSALVVAVGRLDRAVGLELRVLDRATDALLGVLEPAQSREVRVFMEGIKQDQGAVIQLTPEAMDLFQAGVEDRPGVRYQSTASLAPAPTTRGLLRSALRPWQALSRTLFASLYGLTARYDERYPCAAPDAGADAEAMLARAADRSPGARVNDGVVPLRSQVWGRLIWAGVADHLDVLGHFQDDGAARDDGPHADWLASGSAFSRAQFDELMRVITRGMLASHPRLAEG